MLSLEERERYEKLFDQMDDSKLIRHLKNSLGNANYLLGDALSDEFTIQGIMKEILKKRGIKI